MRAWAKISGYTVAVIVLAVLAALVSVQSPAVQEKIGRAVVNRLEKSMDADITTGAISIQPLEAICLRDVVIMDKEPVIPGTDTVARTGTCLVIVIPTADILQSHHVLVVVVFAGRF
ncbi:MAG: hypothetical protein IKN13_00965, partial [Bacteroidales bacterium]|nr:hypothetical protein [Bacteroidales bacterium]